MARMSMKQRKKRMMTSRNIALLIAFVAVLMLGASSFFSAFGPSSAWEADVELGAVASDGVWYTTREEIDSLGGWPTARLIKADFDGDPIVQHAESDTVSYTGLLAWEAQHFSGDSPGMQPTVDFAVGQMYLSDADGNIVSTYYGDWEDVDEDTGLLRFYFAFSMAYTTRAIAIPNTYNGYVLSLDSYDEYIAVFSEGIPEIGPVNVENVVEVRVGNNVSDYTYKGFVDDVRLINTRARYTYDADAMGVSNESINTFNSEYDWKAVFETGYAKPIDIVSPIDTLYNVIDSDSENVAQISSGAKLKPAIDANILEEVFAPTALRGGPDSKAVDDLTVYNVELIYDVVCEVTLNGIPLTAKGDLLTGRTDVIFVPPKTELPPWWQQYLWLIIIVVAFVFGGMYKKRS